MAQPDQENKTARLETRWYVFPYRPQRRKSCGYGGSDTDTLTHDLFKTTRFPGRTTAHKPVDVLETRTTRRTDE